MMNFNPRKSEIIFHLRVSAVEIVEKFYGTNEKNKNYLLQITVRENAPI